MLIVDVRFPDLPLQYLEEIWELKGLNFAVQREVLEESLGDLAKLAEPRRADRGGYRPVTHN